MSENSLFNENEEEAFFSRMKSPNFFWARKPLCLSASAYSIPIRTARRFATSFVWSKPYFLRRRNERGTFTITSARIKALRALSASDDAIKSKSASLRVTFAVQMILCVIPLLR